jgi:enoyl-CoA hydratase/carnithine racemase
MNTEILDTEIVDGIAVVTLGSPKRLYFDAEMGDALTGALETLAGDHQVRVVIITGGAPGYFNRHFDIPALIRIAEELRASGREWPENASYNGGFFDKAMALCETMPKPVIAPFRAPQSPAPSSSLSAAICALQRMATTFWACRR